MLCFVCLTETREQPNKYVTFVQGTAVCREHVTSVGQADLLSLSYKIRDAVSRRTNQNRTQINDFAGKSVANLGEHGDGEAENS